MRDNLKEYVLFPGITAVVCTGINLFADWRRNTVDAFWAYFLMAFVMFIIIACGKLIIKKKKN